MDKDMGVPPSGSGHSAEPEPSCTVSAVPVSVPNAGELLAKFANWLSYVKGETGWAPELEIEEFEAVLALAGVKSARKRSWADQFHIVFSPDGETPPLVKHPTHKGALWSAWQMAAKHPDSTFFVMSSTSRPCTASAIEARRAETQSGSVHESATANGGDAHPSEPPRHP